MVLLPLGVVLVVVGLVYVARFRREHAVAAGGDATATVYHAEPMSPVGRSSVIVLLAAVVFLALTYSALPIYYVAAIAGVAFLLALFAVTVRHDRSPLLLIPIAGVPLAGAFSLAFVLLQ
jgi:hypothetical protein